MTKFLRPRVFLGKILHATRVVVEVNGDSGERAEDLCCDWISGIQEDPFQKNWTYQTGGYEGKRHLFAFFESEEDAVLFRLMIP